jgi:hypothetical protein
MGRFVAAASIMGDGVVVYGDNGSGGGDYVCDLVRRVLVQAVPLGATRRTSMRVNEPSRTGHLAIAVSQATPLASAKAPVVPDEC